MTGRGDAPAIVATGLTKRYGDVTAVDDLSFEVRSGAVTGFLGPNGAGKTTTLRMVLGLARPTAGRATILGRPFTELAGAGALGRRQPRDLRACIRAARGATTCARSPTFAGLPASRVEEVLRPGRDDATRPTGERAATRPGCASASASPPRCSAIREVLVLDEPANGLDPQGIRWLRDFLRGAAAEGRTVLVSSHVLSEVEQTVDDVVVIHRGRLVKSGSIAEPHDGDRRPGALARRPRSSRAALERDGAEVPGRRDAARGAGRDAPTRSAISPSRSACRCTSSPRRQPRSRRSSSR